MSAAPSLQARAGQDGPWRPGFRAGPGGGARRLGAILLAGALGTLLAAPAAARTVEVHVVVQTDLQRVQPQGPPDEPLEPAPSAQQLARTLAAAHPAFRGVNLLVFASRVPPNPREPADFLRLVDDGVDEVVVVDLRYHLRLDSFRGSGAAGVRGAVAVHSVAGRRQVLSRTFAVTATYPGDLTREAVIQAELAQRARGSPVPVELLELGLLDGLLKRRLEAALRQALAVYHAPSLPQVSVRRVQETMEELARFLARLPERREEAVEVLQQCLRRFPESASRPDLEALLRGLRAPGPRDPRVQAERERERQATRVARTLTASELAQLFERLVGAVVEVREFKLAWQQDALWLMPPRETQAFLVDQVPPRVRELPADPPAMFVRVVGRRPDEALPAVDVKVPVLEWVGCPRTACWPAP